MIASNVVEKAQSSIFCYAKMLCFSLSPKSLHLQVVSIWQCSLRRPWCLNIVFSPFFILRPLHWSGMGKNTGAWASTFNCRDSGILIRTMFNLVMIGNELLVPDSCMYYQWTIQQGQIKDPFVNVGFFCCAFLNAKLTSQLWTTILAKIETLTPTDQYLFLSSFFNL